MIATNHALTGAIIGLVVQEPLLAVPAAFISHFICDAIPHFAFDQHNDNIIKTKLFRNYLVVDAGLCVSLVLALALWQPQNWLLAAVCAFLATSPDFFWINRFLKKRGGKPWKPSLYSKFAQGIQWFQRPIGAVVEVAWLIGALMLVQSFLF